MPACRWRASLDISEIQYQAESVFKAGIFGRIPFQPVVIYRITCISLPVVFLEKKKWFFIKSQSS
jgi:hypothetical protein